MVFLRVAALSSLGLIARAARYTPRTSTQISLVQNQYIRNPTHLAANSNAFLDADARLVIKDLARPYTGAVPHLAYQAAPCSGVW